MSNIYDKGAQMDRITLINSGLGAVMGFSNFGDSLKKVIKS